MISKNALEVEFEIGGNIWGGMDGMCWVCS